MSRKLALPIPHLVYEDWEPYMESIFDTEDDKVKAMVLSQRKHVTERRIRKVNELYDAMKEIWPDGNSLLFYIALVIQYPGNRRNRYPGFFRDIINIHIILLQSMIHT